jgi:hypothetical protein
MPRKIWTAAELDEMTPAEVDGLFKESLVTDLDEVPPEFLARVLSDVEEHIASSHSTRKR